MTNHKIQLNRKRCVSRAYFDIMSGLSDKPNEQVKSCFQRFCQIFEGLWNKWKMTMEYEYANKSYSFRLKFFQMENSQLNNSSPWNSSLSCAHYSLFFSYFPVSLHDSDIAKAAHTNIVFLSRFLLCFLFRSTQTCCLWTRVDCQRIARCFNVTQHLLLNRLNVKFENQFSFICVRFSVSLLAVFD